MESQEARKIFADAFQDTVVIGGVGLHKGS